MAAVTLTPADLEPFADIDEGKALAMIEDALARAARFAPCILTAEFEHAAAAKAIIRGAILRWNEAGQGSIQHQGAGPFLQSIDTKQPRKSMFWPTEITELQSLCAESGDGGAFSIDMAPTTTAMHADTCRLNLGGDYCDCGANIAGFPLWGT